MTFLSWCLGVPLNARDYVIRVSQIVSDKQ